MSERASTRGRERPILFSAPMVRALLAGTKTQTRRVLKLPTKTEGGFPIYERPDMGGWDPTTVGGAGCTYRNGSPAPEMVAIWHQTTGICMSAPIQAGDSLWVREAWACHWSTDDQKPSDIEPGLWSVRYFADDHIRPAQADGSVARLDQFKRKRPSMFMPRWASRLTLTVTDVRVQRLQEISEEDARSEGVECDSDGWRDYQMPATQCCATAKTSFLTLWSSINGAGSWEANPWVAAYTFTVERRNIDANPTPDGGAGR